MKTNYYTSLINWAVFLSWLLTWVEPVKGLITFYGIFVLATVQMLCSAYIIYFSVDPAKSLARIHLSLSILTVIGLFSGWLPYTLIAAIAIIPLLVLSFRVCYLHDTAQYSKTIPHETTMENK